MLGIVDLQGTDSAAPARAATGVLDAQLTQMAPLQIAGMTFERFPRRQLIDGSHGTLLQQTV